jgi:membrane peptidoglycan carboxypeptidase
MVSSYGVFATEGVRLEPQAVLKVEDANGTVLEEFSPQGGQRVLDENVAREISDVLSDNVARTPLFGENSFLYFGETKVAGKTGTTNNNKDAWMIGYTPNIAVGVWSGNNDNKPMKKGSAISGRLWREFMDVALRKTERDSFVSPSINTSLDLKPALRGIWQGGKAVMIDSISGKLATEFTPEETKKDLVLTDVHSTLYWINRDNILGEAPGPQTNQQYINWETSVQDWWQKNKGNYPIVTASDLPTGYDTVHTESTKPKISITSPTQNSIYASNEPILIKTNQNTHYPIKTVDFYINDQYLGSKTSAPFDFSFIPKDIENINNVNEVRVIIKDSVYNQAETSVVFQTDL